jgi:hypothetical protein
MSNFRHVSEFTPDLGELAARIAFARDLDHAPRLWLADALRRVAAGEDPRRAFALPRQTERARRLAARDGLVRALARLMPQKTRHERAEAIAQLLAREDGESGPAAVLELVRGLRAAGAPRSARQIDRILRESR